MVLDDDRILEVNSLTVNEGSPYVVFTVSGADGQLLKLSLADQNDDGANLVDLEYLSGGAWVPYVPGSNVSLSGTSLLVRVVLGPEQEKGIDGPETFRLVASNTAGTPSAITHGIATIQDDGTGDIFNNDGTTDSAAVKDDDRPLTINNFTVKEEIGSAVFTVSGYPNQKVLLNLESGTGPDIKLLAILNSDFGPSMEYSTNDGVNWSSYTPDSYVSLNDSGKLAVRTPILQDALYEPSEVFTLSAKNTGGTSNDTTGTDKGIGTITEEPGAVVIAPVLPDDSDDTVGFKLDRQSGLYEQTVRITNQNSFAIQGFRFTLDLPVGAKLFNANSENGSGVPTISYHQELAPGGYVDMLVKVLYQPLSSTGLDGDRIGATLNGLLGAVPYRVEFIITETNTTPNKIDSDDDGISDVDEIKYGTDPNKADSDGDGVNDWAELFVMFSDPNKVSYSSDPRLSLTPAKQNYRVAAGVYEALPYSEASGLTSKLSLKLSPSGGFTADVIGSFGRASLRGRFNEAGRWSGTSSNASLGAVQLVMAPQPNGSFYIEGSMATTGSGTLLFQARPARAAIAKKVTFKASLVDGDGGPQGDAVATGSIAKNGKVRFNIYLPDGKRASYAGQVLDGGMIALYVRAKGGDVPVMLGNLILRSLDTGSDLDGVVFLSTRNYDQQRALQGSSYRVPAKAALPLSSISVGANNSQIVWEGGAFDGIKKTATWSPSKISAVTSVKDKTSVSYDRNTGLIQVTYQSKDVASPLNQKTATGYAVVVQRMNLAQGFYNSPGSSGGFSIKSITAP